MLVRFSLLLAILAATTATSVAYPIDFAPGFHTSSVHVDGRIISATVGGHGPAVVLLHGYAEDSRKWKPLAQKLATR
jgi:alpha-beta hydrolase superfamily lysophospholipase